MKRIPSIFLLSATLLSACSTTQHTGRSSTGDDMYYSLADARNIQPVYHEDIKMQDVSPANSSDYSGSDNNSSNPNFDYNQYKQENGIDQPQQTTDQNANYNSPQYTDSYYDDQNGKTYITNNYYGDGYNDDDYYYAARIRRFHNPYAGFGYYSPAYSGFYGDPFYSSGFSIGIGYSWGWGATSIYSSWYDPFWYPYTSYYSFYNPWYNPWYSPYYNGYRHGYWNGYNDGYWSGGSGGGYSPGNTINGPRPRRGGDVAGGGRPGGTPGSNVSPGGTADRVIDNSNGSGRVRPGATPTGTTPANTESRFERKPSRVRPNGYTAPSLPNNNTNISDRNTNPNTPVIRDGGTHPSNSGREPAPAPVKINPNVRPSTPTTRPNNSNYSRPRQRESSTVPQQPQPQPQSTPRFESAPSRSSSGSSSPGGSSGGNSGGGSAPSRSRPR